MLELGLKRKKARHLPGNKRRKERKITYLVVFVSMIGLYHPGSGKRLVSSRTCRLPLLCVLRSVHTYVTNPYLHNPSFL